jgi:hypothetical protein
LVTWTTILAVIKWMCFLPYALLGLSLPGVRLGYMDYTGCHQLNRVVTHNDNAQ